ncbi:hypothetical protein ABTE24_20350, partial [Acinetobacter baumannii]
DEKPEDAGLAPDAGRARRTPPTIDLEATEVSTQPQQATDEPPTQAVSDPVVDEPVKVGEAGEEAHDKAKPDEPEFRPADAEAAIE